MNRLGKFIFTATILGSSVGLANPGAMLQSMLSAQGACYELDSTWTPQWSNLVAYWKLNEASGASTVADSAGTSTGTVVGGVTLGSAGRLNTAALLNGSSGYINIGHPAAIRPAFPLTISAWMKVSNFNSQYMVATNDTYDGSNYCGAHILLLTTGAIGAELGNCGGVGPAYRSSFQTTSTLTANKWYHLVAVFNAYNNISVYVNGVSWAGGFSGSATTMVYSASSNGFIGYKGASSPSYFPGTVDDVAIWKTGLTATEAKTIYDQQSCGKN